MRKSLVSFGLVVALAIPSLAAAEGFAINEWSAEGVAMGGARMFGEDDAANLGYNPAAITRLPGTRFKASATYISPHGKYKIFGLNNDAFENGHNQVHPAWAPGTFYVRQMNKKDWIGVGTMSRFAMASFFNRNSLASKSGFVSKLNGVSVGPTYAHKFDDKWSAAVGVEMNYVGLTLENNTLGAPSHTKGDSYAFGWNVAGTYHFDDKNDFGIVYRSRVKHSLEADFHLYKPGQTISGDAYGVVTLPDSWAFGYSHKFGKKTRVELNATWTNWSTYDALNIHISPLRMDANSNKNWSDGWRYAIGVEQKISDKYSIMAGYSYDESSIPNYPNVGGDFLVPTGRRQTFSIGGRYNDKNQSLAIALGYMYIDGLKFGFGDAGGKKYYARTHDNSAKVFSIGYERRF